MIKKLRIQLICVNMVIVAIMLSLLIGMLVYFLRRSIERQQFATLHRIANGVITEADVDEKGGGRQNPLHFTVEFDDGGKLRGYGESSYDLEDEDFLREYSDEMYMAAKMAAILAKEHEKYDSILEEEEEEAADGEEPAMEVQSVEAFVEGGEVTDVSTATTEVAVP